MTVKFEGEIQDTQDLRGDASDLLKNLSEQDFLDLGVQDVAYIRPVNVEGKERFSIHAADGTPLSVMESHDKAIGTVIQNDLEAATLH